MPGAISREKMTLEEEDLNETDRGILRLLTEGRITPRFAANELDLQQPYISQRLKRLREHGHVRRVDRGLYELAADPRDAGGAESDERGVQSGRGDRAGRRPAGREAADHRRDEGASNDVELDEVLEGWPGRREGKREARRAAGRAALELLQEHPGKGFQRAEFVGALLDEYPVEGQSEDTYWRKSLRPALQRGIDAGVVEHRQGPPHIYVWVGESDSA